MINENVQDETLEKAIQDAGDADGSLPEVADAGQKSGAESSEPGNSSGTVDDDVDSADEDEDEDEEVESDGSPELE